MPMLPPSELFPSFASLKARISLSEDGTPKAPEQTEPPDFISELNKVRYSYHGKDVGVGGAFVEGVGKGLTMPFNIFTPGVRQPNPEIDTGSEKVANFIGTMAGLGIGFYPITKGVGLAMRGIGLTAQLSAPVAQFVKMTLSGGLQAAGTAEKSEDVPREAAIGMAAGAVVDLWFLRKAMQARAPGTGLARMQMGWTGGPKGGGGGGAGGAGGVSDDIGRIGTSKALATEDIPEAVWEVIPDNLPATRGVSLVPYEAEAARNWPPGTNVLALEQAIVPTEAHSAAYATRLIQGLSDEAQDLPKVVAGLTQGFEETARVTGLTPEAATALTKLPDEESVAQAFKLVAQQRVRRKLFNPTARSPKRPSSNELYEVIIHNPTDPADLLTPAQISQWDKTGLYEGMAVEYRGIMHSVGKDVAPPGRVQLKNAAGTVFAAKQSDVVIPTLTRNLIHEAEKKAKLSLDLVRARTLAPSTQVGFRTRISETEALEGVVDVTDYVDAPSLQAYVDEMRGTMIKRGVDVSKPEEAALQYAKMQGFKGFVEKEGNVVKKVYVLDPETVKTNPTQAAAEAVDDGFDRSMVYYHGTNVPFDKFKGEAYFTKSSRTAGIYATERLGRVELEGANIRPVHLRTGRKYVADERIKPSKNLTPEQAKAAGYDSWSRVTVFGEEEVAVFDPKNIQSVFEPNVGVVPSQGAYFDEVALVTLPEGSQGVSSIIPSWRSQTEASLRQLGYAEKDLDHMLDLAKQLEMEGMISSMDNETKAAYHAAQGQFFGGCL